MIFNSYKNFILLVSAILTVVMFFSAPIFAETDSGENNIRIGYFTMENFMEGGKNSSVHSGFSTLFEVGAHGVHFAVAKDRDDLVEDIDDALKKINDVSPFLISDLKEKYLSQSLSSYSLSQAEKDWLENHDVLRIGGLKNDVPYAYEDKNGDVVGAYVEMTDLIFKNLSLDSLNVE